MSDSNPKIRFDFRGAMRSLGRMTRKGIDTVREKTGTEEPDEAQEAGREGGKDASGRKADKDER